MIERARCADIGADMIWNPSVFTHALACMLWLLQMMRVNAVSAVFAYCDGPYIWNDRTSSLCGHRGGHDLEAVCFPSSTVFHAVASPDDACQRSLRGLCIL